MPALNNYRIFVSHAWTYNESYYRLLKYLDAAPNFSYHNYSVPEHDGVTGGNKLAENLRNQIRPVHVVMVLGGMYVAHSIWLKFEINFARDLRKPILAVRPWGAERMPEDLTAVADAIVGWNSSSIVDAIRLLAR
jgi:hypothetical protein